MFLSQLHLAIYTVAKNKSSDLLLHMLEEVSQASRTGAGLQHSVLDCDLGLMYYYCY